MWFIENNTSFSEQKIHFYNKITKQSNIFCIKIMKNNKKDNEIYFFLI